MSGASLSCVDCGAELWAPGRAARCRSCARKEVYRLKRVDACVGLVRRLSECVARVRVVTGPREFANAFHLQDTDTPRRIDQDLDRLEAQLADLANDVMVERMG